MVKKILTALFTALAVRGMVAVSAYAESANKVEMDGFGGISVTSENAKEEKATTMHLSIKITSAKEEAVSDEEASEAQNEESDTSSNQEGFNVSFAFNNDIPIAESRYNAETGMLNVYMSSADTLFKEETIDIGSPVVTNDEGEFVPYAAKVESNALSFVSKQNQVDESDKLDGFKDSNSKITGFTKIITMSTPDKYSHLNVSTYVKSSFLVVIPDGEIDIKNGADMSVAARKVMISDNQVLDIAVYSPNGWYLVNSKAGSTEKLKYEVTLEDGTKLTGSEPHTLLSVNAGEYSEEHIRTRMKATVTGTPKVSGTYRDNLTFKVSVSEKNQPS
ncbi:MAG: hypothetical protein NC177_08260 [Ruminococcus flavefaciens]|nr:hypothetical protein [Ruminococcus flavefaciens]